MTELFTNRSLSSETLSSGKSVESPFDTTASQERSYCNFTSVAGIIRLEGRCGSVNSRGHIHHVSPSFRRLGPELLQRMLQVFSFISSSVESTSASAGHFLSSAAAQKKTSVLVAGYCDMFTEDPHTLQFGTGNARQCCERVLSSHVDFVPVFGALFGLWR